MFQKSTLGIAAILMASGLYAQEVITLEPNETTQVWYHQNHDSSGYYGVSTNEALKALEAKESNEIIVAIMDSGIDTTHEDLKAQLWVNAGEIPNNGIDDDNNGYIDDVHGWNFLGGAEGNVEEETLELTRIYRGYLEAWEGLDRDSIEDASPEEYDLFESLQKDLSKQRSGEKMELGFITQLLENVSPHFEAVEKALGENYTDKDLHALAESDRKEARNARYVMTYIEQGLTPEELTEAVDYYSASLDYHLNVNFNGREIIGDDPNDFTDTIYGNNDLMGRNSDHGTHVAGIVGAIRNNGLGMDGIAPNVKIMVIRVVPDGDEYDKDVVQGIKYAVRNGASIINMSFGKDYSPHADKVREAIHFAEDNNVLIVHAAGNDSKDIDKYDNFPSLPFKENNAENENWIEVGASTRFNDRLQADFSNYGDQTVDIFAPGDDIYSTLPPNTYGFNSGTSMAAPVVTGVAALIWSYYPHLTAADLKSVLMESSIKPDNGKLDETSIYGGIVNAESAIEYLEAPLDIEIEMEEVEE